MKIRNAMLAAGAGMLLAVSSGVALAKPSPQKQAPAGKQVLPKPNQKAAGSVSRGTISSLSSDRLVISQIKGGKAEDQTFMLNSQTARSGDLKPGARVSIHYRTENNQLLATQIQATPAKAAGNSKKTAVKN